MTRVLNHSFLAAATLPQPLDSLVCYQIKEVYMPRQRNVQKQNDDTVVSLRSTAEHFRVHGVSPVIEAFLSGHGVVLSTSAIVWAHTENYMLGFDFGFGGLVVTQDHRFFEFEVELDASLEKVIFVHEFTEVTKLQNTSTQNRGIGKGYGALAIEVVDALNALEPALIGKASV
jgi:hypothetical protein